MYETLITKRGQELLAKALSTNTQVALKEIRFSDYSGAINENMSVLASIKHTQDITNNTIDPLNANTLIIETLIPANIGGFYIETLGVYTDKGELFALAKINSTYKPLLSENLATDLHIKLYLQVGNASNVVLNIDESVVLASREFVNTELLLIKDEFNKSQSLQDNKISALETNKADKTTTYTKTEVDTSQNAQDIRTTANEINTQKLISDLALEVSRLKTAVNLRGGVGMIFMFSGATENIPSNFMLCDGRELSKTEYPQLFNAIGTIYGESVDKLKFKIPDLRGCFTRCVGGNAGALGVSQSDAIRDITGGLMALDNRPQTTAGAFKALKCWHPSISGGGGASGWVYDFKASRVVPTANENRPINMALNYVIQISE